MPPGRPRNKAIGAAVLAALTWHVLATSALAEPQRVVSMNVCTDQLAMLLAAPGQLVSVSKLAIDPGSSAMTQEAAAYPLNNGLAEEIFLMQPDLVLAGTFTTRATVSMLRRLGFVVEEFAPESSFDDVRANIGRMGAILGREERAAELVADLDEGLADLAETAIPGMLAASYASNSFTAGIGSLADAVMVAAGLENLGARIGILGSGRLPLEIMVIARPDILAEADGDYDTPALAQENFVHPAYRAVRDSSQVARVSEAWSVCGGPFNVAAARILQDAARAARTDGPQQ